MLWYISQDLGLGLMLVQDWNGRRELVNAAMKLWVQSKGVHVRLGVNKWSDVNCSGVEWTNVIYVKWFRFEVKWSEVKWSEVRWSEVKWSYGEVLGGKKVAWNLGWPDTEGTRVYCDYLSWCVPCTVVVWICFVMCGCVYVWGFVLCGCV
jgi:hypothetical protein